MAITTGQTSIGTTATAIDGLNQMPYRIKFQNIDNTDAVFIGNETVTTTTGFRIDKGQTVEMIINPLDVLYAVSTKAGHPVCWIRETL
jgi:hypothetical protein